MCTCIAAAGETLAMATRRVKTKNRGQAYTGPSYKMPPWMKKKARGKRGRGRGRRGRGGRGGGRSGNHERKKKCQMHRRICWKKKRRRKKLKANEIDDKPKVGLVDVSVKLPSQFRKDEIFELSMSKSKHFNYSQTSFQTTANSG